MFKKELRKTLLNPVYVLAFLFVLSLTVIIGINNYNNYFSYISYETTIADDGNVTSSFLSGKSALEYDTYKSKKHEGIFDISKIEKYKLMDESENPFMHSKIEETFIFFAKSPNAQTVIKENFKMSYKFSPNWTFTYDQIKEFGTLQIVLLIITIILASIPFTKDYDSKTNELFLTTKLGHFDKIKSRYFSTLTAITIFSFAFFGITLLVNSILFGFYPTGGSALFHVNNLPENLPLSISLVNATLLKYFLLWLSLVFICNIVFIFSAMLKSIIKAIIVSTEVIVVQYFVFTSWKMVNNIIFVFMPFQFLFSEKTDDITFIFLLITPFVVAGFSVFTLLFLKNKLKKETEG